jgi:uncharacterized protein YndB with AHSA1/START domain
MSTTSTREAEIHVDPDVPLVRITREFDFPVEKVFRAHVDPDLFARWMGPRGLDVTVEAFDCRTGGAYRYSHSDDNGTYRFYGGFHEVRPNELIVQTFTFEGFPDGVALEKMWFEELPDGRCRIVTTSLVDSFEGRDGFAASGMEVGVQEGYQKLDELLAEAP